MATMTLGELATKLGADLVASPDASAVPVTGVSGIETAGPGHITFVANPKYAAKAKTTAAAAVIVEPGFGPLTVPTLRIKNPYLAWSRTIEIFHPSPLYPPGVHPTAVVAESASIGARAHIGPYVVISEGCVLGDDAVLLPHAVLYPGVTVGDRFLAHAHSVVRENCVIGDDVILQNGVIVGSDGFGFAKDDAGRWQKIVQAGPAVIESDVEIQANACIDRASVGETRIRRGAKIDNLVQVGHGCEVGENTLLCAQVGLAGSTTLGKNIILAGQVGTAGHQILGDGVVAMGQTGIHGDIEPGRMIGGSPAMDYKLWLRMTAALNRLPDLVKAMKRDSVK
jgi:UDP-3-O-[3-hydroxymyristoyl] glucosamine N-acyltransferase